MIATLRRMSALLMGLGLGMGLSSVAAAQEAVLSSVVVRVNPGKMDAYLEQVKKLQGVLARLEAGSSIEAWQATAAGPATGTTFVVLEYPNLAAWASSTTKTAADAEYQKLIRGLDALRTVQSVSLYRQVAGPGSVGDVPTGSVLQTVFVRVKPGRLDDYLAKIGKIQGISKRLGTSETIRVWQATAAGEATGAVVVGLLYKDLATYAADTTRLQADPEWQKLIAGLDDMRQVVSLGLARNVGP